MTVGQLRNSHFSDYSITMIKFTNVNKWFGAHHVLKDINFEVNKSKVAVICGPSGSGKSTLIRCINRLETIQSGEIIVDTIKVHEQKRLTELRAEVGFVFQQFNLYPHIRITSYNVCYTKLLRSRTHMPEEKGGRWLQEILAGSRSGNRPLK